MGYFDNLKGSAAEMFIAKGNLIAAVAVLTAEIGKATDADEEGRLRLYRGNTLLKMGDVKDAEQDAQWFLDHKLSPLAEAWLLKARVLHAQGSLEDALTYYNKVLETDTAQAAAYKERGGVYMQMGDKEKAGQDLRAYLLANPSEAAALSGQFEAEGKEGCH